MNAPLPNITELLERGDNPQYEAILRVGTNHFEAYVCTRTGTHALGVFETEAEAKDAINQLKAAHEWELKGIRETGPNEFSAVVRGPRGSYTVGTFTTAAEAEQAIKDVLDARWNG